MKRRHESFIDSVSGPGILPPVESLENTPTWIFKKRRTVEPDNRNGLSRRKSLRDINNLSDHPASVQHDESTTFKITQNKTNRTITASPAQELLPLSRPSTTDPHVELRASPLHDSRSDHQPPLTNIRSSLVAIPGQQQPTSAPASSSRLGIPAPTARPIPSLSRFVSHDKPVRITQSRIPQHNDTASQNKDPDSDQEDVDDEESDEESNGEASEPVTEDPANTDEKQRVESRYAEINKLLGNLFLSRHRNRP